MILSAHQLHYLPWLRYFDKIARSDIFVVLDDIQFNKNGWQNRNKIKVATGAGWLYLTIPVYGKFQQKLNEVRIDNKQRWAEKHLRALITNYSRAKYFNEYIGFFKEIYQKEWEYLNDINYATLFYLLDCLDIKTKIVKSSALGIKSDKTQRLVDICKELNATTYLSGEYAKQVYLDEELLKKENINVIYQKWEPPTYNQLFTTNVGFIKDLSIVDLLFNEGANSLAILQSQSQIVNAI